jgi:hypothetical protein
MLRQFIISGILALFLASCMDEPSPPPTNLPPPVPVAQSRIIKEVVGGINGNEVCYDGVVYLTSYYYSVTPKLSRTGTFIFCE